MNTEFSVKITEAPSGDFRSWFMKDRKSVV